MPEEEDKVGHWIDKIGSWIVRILTAVAAIVAAWQGLNNHDKIQTLENRQTEAKQRLEQVAAPNLAASEVYLRGKAADPDTPPAERVKAAAGAAEASKILKGGD